jgi:hypothetical protein
MAFDTFISYSSKDKTTADMTCAALESAGVRCWIAPRDIRAGIEYAAGIMEGIDSCRIMILIFSSNANASPQVHRELERAVSKGLTIIPFRIEDITPTSAMEYYLGSIHWLDAFSPPLAKHIEQLVQQTKANLQVETGATYTPPGTSESAGPKSVPFDGSENKPVPSLSRAITDKSGQLAVIAIVIIFGSAVFLLWYFLPHPSGPVTVRAPALVITRSAAFGGDGGTAFDDADSNEYRLPISVLKIIVNLNPADTSEQIIGGLQVQWGDRLGLLHGGKGPSPQPQSVNFMPGEKIGRVDVNSMSYHWLPSNTPPLWIAGLKIWTDSQVYTFGNMTFGPTNQCILASGQTLLGFFGRSGSYIDQLGCIIGKTK